ncbi:N-acyl homoserine lactonase family protein [Aquamicrobium lusatiense]|uniref:AttM family quorum-quenching N-acyl homoserine lactonase n=1 Tax=Aquamicrobium lusatiense TaxID=89772 RepID=UPI002457CA05|nr:N-acyl homoserine lactonase family protein [Aquamicrobium lusatiense]MDH4989640.1 N-acyl homoserine lactonase family protein [Aquamicrobium lusatiense]
MTDIRLYMFDTGILKCKYHDIYLNQGGDADHEIPVPFFFITHPKGNVVIDGGTPVECATDPYGHWGKVAEFFYPVLTPEQGCVAQIGKLGFDVDSVRYVVLSHLHLDHVGAVGRFAQATHVVQRNEYEYAFTPDWFASGAYVRKDFDNPALKWLLLEDAWGDFYDLYGDGSIVLIRSPGHTGGHQSILVRTSAGQSILLAVDAADTLDHWEERALPGALHSAVDAVRSVRKLRAVREKTDALVVAGHDGTQWASLKKAPDFY